MTVHRLRKILAIYFILILTDILMSIWATTAYPTKLIETNQALIQSYVIVALVFILLWYESSRVTGNLEKILVLATVFAIVLRVYIIVQNTIVILSVI